MNKTIKKLLHSDFGTIHDSAAQDIAFAICALDRSDCPIAIRAACRLVLVDYIDTHAGEDSAVLASAAIAVARHCHDKNTKKEILQMAVGSGNPEICALLADLEMQAGHTGAAAYRLRQARRNIMGE